MIVRKEPDYAEGEGRFEEGNRVAVKLEAWVTLDPSDWAGDQDLQTSLNIYLQRVGDQVLGHVQVVDVEVSAL